MPYIKQIDRQHYDHSIDSITRSLMETLESNFTEGIPAGDLNYIISKITRAYIKLSGESYSAYNNVIGALECAKLELYRRDITDYETQKIQENGDI